MSEISERYHRLSDQMATTVANVAGDQWDATTPCEEWTALDLVRHLVDTQGMFLGFVSKEVGDLASVDDDPAAAWDGARAAIQTQLDDAEGAVAEFDGFTGRTTLEAAVDRFLCTDLVLHGWDLATATGQTVTIDPDDMAHIREAMAPLADKMRGPSAFGPELDAPTDADDQTTFLAFFGRRAWS